MSGKKCTLCGNDLYNITPFKSGFVCEDCVHYIISQDR